MTVSEAKEKFINLDGYDELANDENYYEDQCQGEFIIKLAKGLGISSNFISVQEDCESFLIKNLAKGIIFNTQEKLKSIHQKEMKVSF